MVMRDIIYSKEECVKLFAHFAGDAPSMNILGLDPLFYTTKEFCEWWNILHARTYGGIILFKKRQAEAFENDYEGGFFNPYNKTCCITSGGKKEKIKEVST